VADDPEVMGELARQDVYPDETGFQPPPPGMLDYLRSGARTVVKGLDTASGYLGIPPGEIRNDAGDVVFPTNALERGLQSTSDDAKTYAAAVMGPGKAPKAGLTGFAPGRMGDLAEIKAPAIIKSDVSAASPYVSDPLRVANPGIYKRPDVIASEAAANVAPEHPALKELFGVTRDDLYGISQQGTRQGNVEPSIWMPSRPGKGSYAADAIMNPANAQRMVDTLSEAQKYPELIKGMDPWYVMDPLYQRMVELVGPEQAKIDYMRFNATVSPFSAGSNVPTEINRGTAANMMVTRGEYPKFMENAGIAAKNRGPDFPSELADVKGHAYHAVQSDPVARWLETGEHGYSKDTVKIPLYMQASGVPQTGFQTRLPVPDAHYTRATGMPDVRRSKDFNDYMGGSEYRPVGPWFRENVAKPLGIEAVPAQARMWGTYAPQTGVDTKIGAGKLELLSQNIWERARKLGIDPKVLRDEVLRGQNHSELMGDVLNPGGYTA
jgi:hypothetical protein